ncbi:MAG: complex I subunit 5 family protein [Natronospirillum sp.]|uniref:complex I subunit 5 family protein n=1 Tax=Natronospirillum sp. TaxID=2812955 RepID=UPI0025E26927|nr:complex I subunit 5 family protein [Natronospirillum sp.]MCH8551543.1 complex I subunit 5 family protein [Natronospirillum sp.]
MAWLWLLIPLTPLLLVPILMRWPKLRSVVWLAPLPALPLAFMRPDTLVLPGLWPGAQLGIADGLSAILLLFTAALWLAAGLCAVSGHAKDPHARRFWVFWLLSMTGNLLLILAQDGASFYVGFTLMSLSAFGLVIHNGTTESRRAGRLYLQLAIVGELLLFMGLMLRVHEADGSMLLTAWQETPAGLPTLICLLIGFGLKAGFWPLHVWLPAAHPAAPAAASAVLSGAMIKAGIIGLWRFMPRGSGEEVMSLPASVAPWLLAIGLISAFYGVAVGLLQTRDKTALAYSSVSQMGYLLVLVALLLSQSVSVEALGLLLGFYVVHHGLAKGALFLGAGMAHEYRLSRVHWVLMALPAVALAGFPLTTGAVAKSLLKDQVGNSAFAAWEILFYVGSMATLLLVSRALWLIWRSQPGGPPATMPLPWKLGWGSLCLAAPVLPWLWPDLRVALLDTLSLYGLWGLMWPLLLGAVVIALVVRFNPQWHLERLARYQPGLVLSLRLRRWLQTRPVARDPMLPERPVRMPWAGWRNLERRWNRLGRDVVQVSAWVMALGLLWVLL